MASIQIYKSTKCYSCSYGIVHGMQFLSSVSFLDKHHFSSSNSILLLSMNNLSFAQNIENKEVKMPQFLFSKVNLEQQNLINYIRQCKNQLLLLFRIKKNHNRMVWGSKYTHTQRHTPASLSLIVSLCDRQKIYKISCNFLKF